MPNDDDDAFWDELGISWRASIRDTALISRRLETRLKFQSLLLTGAIAVGAAASVMGAALAAWTLWIGWTSETWNFLTRGATLAIASLLATIATSALISRNAVETRSLRELLQVSIARTERWIRAADLACYSVAVLAVGGTIGYGLRIWFARPPAVPVMEDLLAAAVVGLALIGYRRSQMRALRRYRHLDQSFRAGEKLQ